MNLDQIVQLFTDVNHRIAVTVHDSVMWGVFSLVDLAPGFILGVIASTAVLTLLAYRRKQRYDEIDGNYWESLPYEVRAAYRHWHRVHGEWLVSADAAELDSRTRATEQ